MDIFLSAIDWTVNPEIFELGPFHVRWYGLLFASGIVAAYAVVKKMLDAEGSPKEWQESALWWVVIATVVGARLGHVFFYDWADYREHPMDIIKIWEGGLASHGALIGIVLSIFLWSKIVAKRNPFWIMDRLAVGIPIAGAFIRLGNFFNHEIGGHPTDLPWAVRFKYWDVPPGVDPDMMPEVARQGAEIARHPTQIYEMLAYIAVFLILLYFYWRTDKKWQKGFLMGMFFALTFTARFFIEFLKEDQVDFESTMTLNMGQWLSIPVVLIGILLIIYSFRHKWSAEFIAEHAHEKTNRK